MYRRLPVERRSWGGHVTPLHSACPGGGVSGEWSQSQRSRGTWNPRFVFFSQKWPLSQEKFHSMNTPWLYSLVMAFEDYHRKSMGFERINRINSARFLFLIKRTYIDINPEKVIYIYTGIMPDWHLKQQRGGGGVVRWNEISRWLFNAWFNNAPPKLSTSYVFYLVVFMLLVLSCCTFCICCHPLNSLHHDSTLQPHPPPARYSISSLFAICLLYVVIFFVWLLI